MIPELGQLALALAFCIAVLIAALGLAGANRSDWAGMLRSLDYAAHAVGRDAPEGERAARLAALAAWEDRARRAFVAGYRSALSASAVPLAPASEAALLRACAVFELQKACYELRYEMNNRPDWIAIPLAGIIRILD